MKKEIVETTDGSHTLYVPDFDEPYHSKNGAFQESLHVFIQEGLRFRSDLEELSILEVGFGTGLNALTTLVEVESTNRKVQYTSLEAYPLEWEVVDKLNYMDFVDVKRFADYFKLMHTIDWEFFSAITPSFSLRKQKIKLQEVNFEDEFDLIYFDAFAPKVQPDLWTKEIFASISEPSFYVGILTSFFVGCFCIKYLLQYLKSNSFLGFAIYRVILAVFIAVALS